jgi:hypothetical protein
VPILKDLLPPFDRGDCYRRLVLSAAGRFVAVLALGLAVLAAGTSCGSSGGEKAGGGKPLSKIEYQARLTEIVNNQGQRASELFNSIITYEGFMEASPLSKSECAAKSKEFAASLHDIVSAVEKLTPPADVEELQDQFLDQARISVAAVDQAARDAEAGSLHCGEDMNRRIYGLPSTEKAEAVISQLEHKGYFVFGE